MKKKLYFILFAFLFSSFIQGAIIYKITSPDASSKWARGSTKFIKWDKKGDTIPDVKIRLFTSPGNVKVLGITNSTTNKESFSWKIPNGVAMGKYFIRVRTLNNANGGDSDEFEIIAGSGIQVGKSDDKLRRVKQKPDLYPHEGLKKPKINLLWPFPPGALKPGVQLFLKGENFGTKKGKILLKGNFPNGQIELNNVTWENSEKANGFVPKSANGLPNQIVDVVLVNYYNLESDPKKNIGFEGREEKVLTADAVGVKCGIDANGNRCNNYKKSEQGLHEPDFSNEYAICGWHYNVWGAVGNDFGNDYYYISLKNGWTFKSMKKVEWYKSSGDEKLWGPTPSFPAGKTVWDPYIGWFVTPNDEVKYRIKIIVEGPIGTNYK